MVADLDIARWRLRAQHLVSPGDVSAREAVGSLLAVQAENPQSGGMGSGLAYTNPDQADLAALLDGVPFCARTCCGPRGISCGPRTSAGCST